MAHSGRFFLGSAAAILVYQLLLPPIAGLADNGDFSKVTGRFSLYAPVHRVYEYIDPTYEIRADKHWVSDFLSTEILLVHPALWLNSLVSKNPNSTFDLRYIGIVHGALFLCALWLFSPLLDDRPRWMRWTVYALVLFVFCDATYVCALNSFYMDEAAFLFLLLTVVFYLRMRHWGRRRDAVMLILCSFFLVGTKSQHAVLGLWLALLFAGAAGSLGVLRRRWWYASSAFLVMGCLLMIWKAQPADYASPAVYNVVFEKILPHSKNVDRTMAELGLDDSFRRCIGMKAYLPNSGMDDPAFRRKFDERVSLPKLAIFYLRRPAVAWKTMTDAMSEAGMPHLFGSFALSTGYPSFARSHAFALWTDLRGYLFVRHGKRFFFVFFSLMVVMLAILVAGRQRLHQRAWLAGFCLAAGATMELGMATLCDSMDIERHATIFLTMFDLIALTCAGLILHTIHVHALDFGKLLRKLPHHSVKREVEAVSSRIGERRPAEATLGTHQ